MIKGSILLKNGHIVLPDKILTGNVLINKGKIESVVAKPIGDTDLTIDASGKYILPGFIDIHTNGIAGFDLTNGVYNLKTGNFFDDENSYFVGLEKALVQYAQKGVTSVYLTSLAAPIDQLKKIFGYIKKYKIVKNESVCKNVLKGLYIEGTFMKQSEYRGAHNPEYFFEPSIELFKELQNACGGEIKIVNVVPEWGTPALKLTEYLTENNIIPAAGHTGATGHQYEAAIEKGLCLAVHFLNGPTGSSGKSFEGGGAVETILRSDKMRLELIVDGYHVDKAYVLDTIKRKGFDKVIPITDSMFAAEFPGLNNFEVLGIKGEVSKNGEYLHIADRKQSLFGSKLVMPVAFSNLLNWLTSQNEGIWNRSHEQLNFEDALVKTSEMISINPAKLLDIYDSDDKTGSIEEGKKADLIIADIDKTENGYQFRIDKVFVQGKVVN